VLAKRQPAVSRRLGQQRDHAFPVRVRGAQITRGRPGGTSGIFRM